MESPVFARDVNLCLVKDEKTLNKEAPFKFSINFLSPWSKASPPLGQKVFMHLLCRSGKLWPANRKSNPTYKFRGQHVKMLHIFLTNRLFHCYSNNLSNWGKTKISSAKDCNWFLTWKSGTKSLNGPMNESATTYTSCWIRRYITCHDRPCRFGAHLWISYGKGNFILI